MPRISIRNNRDRVWKRNGKGKKFVNPSRYIHTEGFYTECLGCHRLYAIHDNGTFKMLHKTADNITHLYCKGAPNPVGIWLDAGSHNIDDTIALLTPPIV